MQHAIIQILNFFEKFFVKEKQKIKIINDKRIKKLYVELNSKQNNSLDIIY
jgi:hypothetical protein